MFLKFPTQSKLKEIKPVVSTKQKFDRDEFLRTAFLESLDCQHADASDKM